MRKQNKGLAEILEDIKKLLILQVATSGANSELIAEVLGVDSSTIRRLIPFRKIKNLIKKK